MMVFWFFAFKGGDYVVIVKKINNNVVLAQDGDRDFIAMGKGIGFGVNPGQALDENVIDKRFYEADKLSAKQMMRILNDATVGEIEAVSEIVALANENIDSNLNEHFFFTLLDHLSVAIERANQGLELTCPIEWEVKKFYPKAYQVAKLGLSIVEVHLKTILPDSEAAFLALHFVNAQLDSGSNQDIVKITGLTKDIINLIEEMYDCRLETESFFFNRFVTHLRYFLLRQIKGEKLDIDSAFLLETLQQKFPREVHCVNLIEAMLSESKGWSISESEKMYIILHLRNLISKIA